MAHVEQLRKELAAEKAARVNDQLRLAKENGELRSENQKLKVSLSNAEAALGRRGKGSLGDAKQAASCCLITERTVFSPVRSP